MLIEHPKIVQLLDRVSSWTAWKYKQDKDEIRQIILVEMLMKIHTLRDSQHLKQWVYSVARNKSLNKIRHEQVENLYIQNQSRADKWLDGKPLIQSTNVLTPEQEFLIEERMQRATRLFPKEIMLGWAMGKSLREIAEETGKSVEAIYRTLKNIQKTIVEETFSEIEIIKEVETDLGNKELIPAELNHVIETVRRLTPDLIAHLQSHEGDLDKLRWDVFEHLVGEFLASGGFQDVRLVGRNSKTSADVFAVHFVDYLEMKIRYFIEVKRWKKKVGVQIIDQVYGAMLSERPTFGWHAAMIVSLVGFKDFEKYNREVLTLKGIELKDRNDLLRWLRGYKRNSSGLWLPAPYTSLEPELV